MDALTVLLLPLLAVGASLLASLVGKVARVPLVVFEILLGIIVGPSVLGWAHPQEFTDTLAAFGLAILFFVAGNEIDFASINGRPLRRAGFGWLISVVTAVTFAVIFAPNPDAGVFIGVALCSTALGTILPMLRDAGELSTPFGRTVTAIGAVGEFGPLVAISLFLSGRSAGISALVLIAFVIVTGLAIFFAARASNSRLHSLLAASLHTTGQFAIRLIILLIAALVALSIVFKLDMLLGAFAAGVLWRVLSSRAPDAHREVVDTKIEALAFGFFVPIFFISTGMNFDVKTLFTDPRTLLLVPIFLVALLAFRGLPGLLAAPPGAGTRDRIAIVLFGATGLPIIVAVTEIAVKAHAITTGVETALIAAGMLSVLLFPLIALTIRRTKGQPRLGPPTLDEVSDEA